MRSSTRHGRVRLVAIAAAPALVAISIVLAGWPSAQASSASPGARAARVRPAAIGNGWKLLAKQAPAHGGNLDILVALPHGSAWAFGEYGEVAPYTGHPIAEYWNGSAWSVGTLPADPHCGPIAAAGASSASNVWAVGINGCVLRLVGSTWKVAKDWTTVGQFTGITVLSPANVWVFGGTAAPAGKPGFGTWHYNGKTWQQVTGLGGDVQTASAASASDIWAVGVVTVGTSTSTFLEHYNGSTWQRVSGVSRPISVLAAKQVWAVAGATASGELERMTSAGHWTAVAVPGKVFPTLAATDDDGGIWLTSWDHETLSGTVTNLAMHLSSAGKWTITALTSGAAGLELSRIPGTTSMLALGQSGTDAVLYGNGKA